jgi:polycomb protein EED
VFPNSQSFCITNASHLPPRKPPPFPLDVQPSDEDDVTGQLADNAEHMHLGPQHYTRDEELERNAKATNDVAPEEVKLPLLKGWRIDTENGEDTASKLITCAMGLGGRVIVGAGTNKSLWVWRYDE